MLPSAHVLDDLRFDLLLGPVTGGQVEGKDCFLPGHLEPFQIEFGQFQKIACDLVICLKVLEKQKTRSEKAPG